jgi:hypothetical protein
LQQRPENHGLPNGCDRVHRHRAHGA